jgi:hypothetical protein
MFVPATPVTQSLRLQRPVARRQNTESSFGRFDRVHGTFGQNFSLRPRTYLPQTASYVRPWRQRLAELIERSVSATPPHPAMLPFPSCKFVGLYQGRVVVGLLLFLTVICLETARRHLGILHELTDTGREVQKHQDGNSLSLLSNI